LKRFSIGLHANRGWKTLELYHRASSGQGEDDLDERLGAVSSQDGFVLPCHETWGENLHKILAPPYSLLASESIMIGMGGRNYGDLSDA